MPDGLGDLAESFYDAADRTREEVQKVGSKGGLNVKQDTQKKWKALGPRSHLKNLWRSVGYDLVWIGDTLSVQIGPDVDDRKNQGALGGIAEEGTVNNAPVPALAPALIREEPRFEKALGDVVERLADGR